MATSEARPGDTLQAVRGHRFAPVLDRPGRAGPDRARRFRSRCARRGATAGATVDAARRPGRMAEAARHRRARRRRCPTPIPSAPTRSQRRSSAYRRRPRWASCSRSSRSIRPTGRRRRGSHDASPTATATRGRRRRRSTACSAPASATHSRTSTGREDLDAFLGQFTPEAWAERDSPTSAIAFRLAEADGETGRLRQARPAQACRSRPPARRVELQPALRPQEPSRRRHRARR